MSEDATVRFSINIPNFGDFADAHTVARVATAAEEAGWDGLFVWDHVVHSKERRKGQPFGDPWMLLTAAALATSRIKLGPLVTPIARRRPEQLARQVATLDGMSGGRVIFGAGLGGPIDDEFGSLGDETDPKVLAAKLDEGLGLLAGYWSGETVNHEGEHYRVDDVALLPATIQTPRPPVWLAGYWPRKAPMRRAARWDGAVPLFRSANHGEAPPVEEVRELIAFLRDNGAGTTTPYDVIVGGISPADPAQSRALIEPLAEAGATWWDERQLLGGTDFYRLDPVLRRIEQGPPSLG
ncbi:LLM class flavin-dependent oxidoreductase [Kribbella pittospori]|uniref:LLM class flavin-dependent oxidoreductase n=1 Tax=Kribbella pittospori TaxID=722689 RepID=UPI00192D4869|nr:LLM class flavin-dependent oxidoreductase [Kribbella pittospori]